MFGILEFSWPIQLSLDIANVVMFTLTLIAVAGALLQIRRERIRETRRDRDTLERYKQIDIKDREIQRESSAKAMYIEYLKMAFNNPKLSLGKYDEDDDESEDRYDSFVSIMMYSFDEMLNIEEKYWTDAFEYQVSVHQEYLRRILHKSVPEEDSFRGIYSEKLINIIDRIFDNFDSKKVPALDRRRIR